jgi:hypothetical protein
MIIQDLSNILSRFSVWFKKSNTFIKISSGLIIGLLTIYFLPFLFGGWVGVKFKDKIRNKNYRASFLGITTIITLILGISWTSSIFNHNKLESAVASTSQVLGESTQVAHSEDKAIPIIISTIPTFVPTTANPTTILIATSMPLITPTTTLSPVIATPKATPNPTQKVVTATQKPVVVSTYKCKYSCNKADGNKNCGDFTSKQDAQNFFNCCGFTATYDPMGLDTSRGVGDGLACNSYKY